MRLAILTASLALASLTAFASGCASEDADSTQGASDAIVSASTPVTLQNFLNHPKIKEVRAEVTATENAHYASESRSADCGDVSEKRTKLTDSAGKVRELIIAWGGSDGDGQTKYYFDADGTLRFVFDVSNVTPPSGALSVVESRDYFDANGMSFFEVKRTARATVAHPPNMEQQPYALPNPNGATPTYPTEVPQYLQANPGEWYNGQICGEDRGR